MSGGSIMETTQCLTFMLGEEIFSLEIARVREVLDYTNITRVPRTPSYVQGVINLRGGVVPVVDLRTRFGMRVGVVSVNTCIIIVEAMVDGEMIILGLLADSVQEVLDLDGESIKPAPRIGAKLDTGFIKGMGRLNDRFIIILDIDRVFSLDELGVVQGVRDITATAGSAQPEVMTLDMGKHAGLNGQNGDSRDGGFEIN